MTMSNAENMISQRVQCRIKREIMFNYVQTAINKNKPNQHLLQTIGKTQNNPIRFNLSTHIEFLLSLNVIYLLISLGIRIHIFL